MIMMESISFENLMRVFFFSFFFYIWLIINILSYSFGAGGITSSSDGGLIYFGSYFITMCSTMRNVAYGRVTSYDTTSNMQPVISARAISHISSKGEEVWVGGGGGRGVFRNTYVVSIPVFG